MAHGLHSRAPALLALVLQEDLLQPGDFKRQPQQAATAGEAAAGEPATAGDGEGERGGEGGREGAVVECKCIQR